MSTLLAVIHSFISLISISFKLTVDKPQPLSTSAHMTRITKTKSQYRCDQFVKHRWI